MSIELRRVPRSRRLLWKHIKLGLEFPRHSLEEAYILKRWKEVGRQINLRAPRTFAEKIEWLKLNDCRPQYINLVDKVLVRNYVLIATGDSSLMTQLHGVYSSVDEVSLNDLPEQFVVKTNHWSGQVIICKDREQFDWDYARRKLNNWMHKKYAPFSGEWPYWHISPRLLVEEYLEDQFEELVDYKIFCFNGEPRLVMVCVNRFGELGMHRLFLDVNWRVLEMRDKYPVIKRREFPRPASLNKMLAIAGQLSAGTYFLRVDFYDIFGTPKLGELTLYPESGLGSWFNPEEWNYTLGDWITLPTQELGRTMEKRGF